MHPTDLDIGIFTKKPYQMAAVTYFKTGCLGDRQQDTASTSLHHSTTEANPPLWPSSMCRSSTFLYQSCLPAPKISCNGSGEELPTKLTWKEGQARASARSWCVMWRCSIALSQGFKSQMCEENKAPRQAPRPQAKKHTTHGARGSAESPATGRWAGWDRNLWSLFWSQTFQLAPGAPFHH